MGNILHVSWSSLSTSQLYKILKLRSQVFVVEQICHYLDLDDLDQISQHFWVQQEAEVVAYLRVISQKDHYRIGRVCTVKKFRKNGFASQLMDAAMNWIENSPPKETVILSAQHHLVSYYAQWGFKPKGSVYLDVGIPHQDMEIQSLT